MHLYYKRMIFFYYNVLSLFTLFIYKKFKFYNFKNWVDKSFYSYKVKDLNISLIFPIVLRLFFSLLLFFFLIIYDLLSFFFLCFFLFHLYDNLNFFFLFQNFFLSSSLCFVFLDIFLSIFNYFFFQYQYFYL